MKKLLVLFISVLMFATLGMAQVWEYDSDFKTNSQPHGVVVDANGKIWIGWYAYTDTLGLPNDTIPIAPIYVFNEDGSQVEFSPIRTLTVDGVTDTIDTWARGLSLDHNGNVLFTGNQMMYRINYQTGEGMNKYLYPATGSLTSAGADENGFIYVTKVVPGGGPLVILDEDFGYYSNVVDELGTIQRTLLVSPTGEDVYVGTIYAGVNGVRHYFGELGPDGEYTEVDTIGTVFYEGTTDAKHIMWAQSINWDNNGLMWVGTYWDVGEQDFNGWYALDPTQDWAIVDTLGHGIPYVLGVLPEGGAYYSPRHVAFSLDGTVAYAADFDGGVVKKWTNASPKGPGSTPIALDELVSIRYKDGKPVIAVDFDLKQNYPNPFNPTTKIPFDIGENVHVKLVVYDMNGRLVQTLVDQQLMPRRYEYEFDGSNLASGTYFYQLIVNGQQITKQMLLIK